MALEPLVLDVLKSLHLFGNLQHISLLLCFAAEGRGLGWQLLAHPQWWGALAFSWGGRWGYSFLT